MNRTEVLQAAFNRAMDQEGKQARVFSSGEVFNCFFRRNADSMQSRDSMVLYYPRTAPVNPGSLIEYNGICYLCLNQETQENEVYFKSSVVRCNGKLSTHSFTITDLPFYGSGVTSTAGIKNQHIEFISGAIEILTEDNATSRLLAVDDLFNDWGRTWKVKNRFYIDGLCHVVAEVTADAEPVYNYALTLDKLPSYNVVPEDTAKLTATATINDSPVINPNLVYSSSDLSKATIDQDGNIKYIAGGKVTFTVSWTDHDISQTTAEITIIEKPALDDPSIYVDAVGEIYNDMDNAVYNYYGMRGDKRDDQMPVAFRFENVEGFVNQAAILKRFKFTDYGDHTFTIYVSGASNLDYKHFDLIAFNQELGIENRQRIQIVPFRW